MKESTIAAATVRRGGPRSVLRPSSVPRPSAARRTARWTALAAGLLLLVAAVGASLAIGSLPVPPATVWAALTGGHVSAQDAAVVVALRLPRTAIGLAVGAGLGGSGAIIQALTRNPLADPGVLGVTAGSGFAVALAVSVAGVTAPAGYLWFALAGALLTTVAVFAIGSVGAGGPRPEQLLLGGVALSAVLAGIVSAISLSEPSRFETLQIWAAGSLRDRGWDALTPALPFLAVGVVVALLLGGPLDALALGEDRAASLGSAVARTRAAAVLAIALLAGGATAVAGPISFVGLMVPHLARWATGPDQRWVVALSLVLAPSLLLVSDVAARLVLWPGEAPVGLVTAFVGAPVLVALARRRRAVGP